MAEAEEEESGSGSVGKMKVMVVIDESECSYYTFRWVLNNLRDSFTNHNSPLYVFVAQHSSYHHYSVSSAFGLIFTSFSATSELIISSQRRANKTAMGVIEKVECICAEQGIKVEAITEMGDPKEAICNAVQNNQIKLLVIGDDTNKTMKRPFDGSIGDYCGRKARCPVLVVRK